jgi:unsaturated chondroitin disaccharide hydrolase
MTMDRWISQAVDYSLAQIHRNLAELSSFPELTENGRWRTVDHGGWVGGHWVGLIWLAFACTREKGLETAARIWATRLAPRQFDATTHDLGFLFELSHVLGYELTGDITLKAPALQAAETMCQRFNRQRFLPGLGPPDSPGNCAAVPSSIP